MATELPTATRNGKYTDAEHEIVNTILASRKCHIGIGSSISWKKFHVSYLYEAKKLKLMNKDAIVYDRSMSALEDKVKSLRK
jgi:hypothetical protein